MLGSVHVLESAYVRVRVGVQPVTVEPCGWLVGLFRIVDGGERLCYR